MFQLDYSDHRPIYEQIKDKIKELIVKGILKENDKIPSVRELASILAINPNTIQKAYKDLEAEGVIYSLRAKGSFISSLEDIQSHIDSNELYQKLDADLAELMFLGQSEDDIIKYVKQFYKNNN